MNRESDLQETKLLGFNAKNPDCFAAVVRDFTDIFIQPR